MRRYATTNDWKHLPMPLARELIPYDEEFSAEEMEMIRIGYIPEVMEEKWFIYMEGDWLSLHRSWTGVCIYRVRFEQSGNNFRIAEALANRNKDQRSWESAEIDARDLSSLIHLLLLNQFVPFTSKVGEGDEEKVIRMWGIVGNAMMPKDMGGHLNG